MAFFNHRIHSIDPDVIDAIMICVQNVKHSGTPDGIIAANHVEAYLKTYQAAEAEDEAKCAIIDNLTPPQEAVLKEAHIRNYMGTDDDAPDAYESWLDDQSSTDLKKIFNL